MAVAVEDVINPQVDDEDARDNGLKEDVHGTELLVDALAV